MNFRSLHESNVHTSKLKSHKNFHFGFHYRVGRSKWHADYITVRKRKSVWRCDGGGRREGKSTRCQIWHQEWQWIMCHIKWPYWYVKSHNTQLMAMIHYKLCVRSSLQLLALIRIHVNYRQRDNEKRRTEKNNMMII